MIKKNNKILVGALALLLVMTIGYALFSDTLTINGTATAQGNFDLEYTCELVTENDTIGGISIPPSTGTGTCEVDGNKITATGTLSKPTEAVWYKITITNTGTIPVYVKTIDSNKTTIESDYTMLRYLDENTALLTAFGLFGRSGSGNEELITYKEGIEGRIGVMPGDSIVGLFSQQWLDSKADSSLWLKEQPKLPEGGASISQTITIGFEQITADME